MALVLKFSATLGDDCKSFNFIENTGAYDVSTNPTGWGTPNLSLGSVTSATLTVKNLTTNVTYDDLTITPSSTVGNTTTFTTEDLKVNGTSIGDVTLPDGQYCLIYTITAHSATYQQTIKKVWLCETCCKLKTKACELDLECGCCNDPCADEIWKFLQAWTELKIIEYSAYCSSESNINNKIKSLQSFIQTFDCPNC